MKKVVEKDFIIQDKTKLCSELKAILARQPGPELAEKYSLCQQQLKERSRQMKALVSELNMCQVLSNIYYYQIIVINELSKGSSKRIQIRKRQITT